MRQNLNLVTDPRFAWRTRRFSGYDIPPQEVAELYKLYTQTGGPSWIDHTNWFANKQCSTWFGLTVAGGRVTKIVLPDNALSGTTGFSPKPFASLTQLLVYSTSSSAVSFRYSLGDLPLPIQYVSHLRTASSITGSLSNLPWDTRQAMLYNSQSLIFGGSTPMLAKGISDIRVDNSASTQASKDSIIERIYSDRALFTNAAHALNISGGPALTGVYQTSAAPSTPAEKAYALVNDPNSEGFLKWVITL